MTRKRPIISAASRAGRVLALARDGLGVDDIQAQTGESYHAIAVALGKGPLARLAEARWLEPRRAA